MRRLMLPAVIRAGSPPEAFPPVQRALSEPNGLLAVGGDLSAERLQAAYRRGIFPWYTEREPILWWCPDPRAVLYPEAVRVSRSLRRVMRQGRFTLTADTAFDAVLEACAAPRPGQDGTWISRAMMAAYGRLHALGLAHSLEVWREGRLVGGLYGVALGAVFFGESMFSRQSDTSKIALATLAGMGFQLIDCQVPSAHLASMGAVEIPRERFLGHLDEWCEGPGPGFSVPAAAP
jgi:leucyl/phenylalanyl-tRNA--protein transferase